MNRDDVIDVLTAVAAADRRTVGAADVDVWQAVIGDLPRDFALKAIRAHLQEHPGVWLEPGHIYQRWKTFHRDQLDREPDHAREARQEALAAKAAEDIEELAERKGLNTAPKPFQPRRHPELTVRCPWCAANIGNRCVVPNTTTVLSNGFHPCRTEATQHQQKTP